MSENLRRASESSCLWPPIADAVDTFLRRNVNGAGPYERIWRLIHVWEATAITLAVAAIAAVRAAATYPDAYRRVREFCHGRSWKALDKTFERQVGAFQGSIDRWIDILFELCNYTYAGNPFLTALKRFLEYDRVALRGLVNAWAVTCAVPPDTLRGDLVTVKHALRNINIFRNRFAHVPFPHDPIGPLASAFEEVTEQLFSIEPLPWKIFPESENNSPLIGTFMHRESVLRGCNLFHTHRDQPLDDVQFGFPCPRSEKEAPASMWRADPFVHIDAMSRPYVLSRLIDETIGTWEYTRFRAEANAVVTRDDSELLATLPVPEASEYAAEDEEEKDEESAVAPTPGVRGEQAARAQEITFATAIDAIRNENYDPAIAFFADLTEKRPEYHIGWLRLGHAKREKAMRIRSEEPDQAARLIREAIADLTRATEHRDAPSRAQAYYELSKAHYHLANWSDSTEIRQTARRDAERACELASDRKYRSWLEYLGRA